MRFVQVQFFFLYYYESMVRKTFYAKHCIVDNLNLTPILFVRNILCDNQKLNMKVWIQCNKVFPWKGNTIRMFEQRYCKLFSLTF